MIQRMHIDKPTNTRGFTVLELIVAVSLVTAVLSGMLLLISNQVLETKSKSAAELEAWPTCTLCFRPNTRGSTMCVVQK